MQRSHSLIFFIKEGRPDTTNIDNKTLATLIEARFYAELAQYIEIPIEEILEYRLLQVKGLKNFFKGTGAAVRISLLALKTIGILFDGYSLVTNSYALYHLKKEDESQRPILIASIVLSSLSLGVSIASLGVWALGALGYISVGAVAVASIMLGLIGLVLAIVAIGIFSYFEYEGVRDTQQQVNNYIEKLKEFLSGLKKQIQSPVYTYDNKASFWTPKTNLPISQLKLRKDQIRYTLGHVLYQSRTPFTLFYQMTRECQYSETLKMNPYRWGDFAKIFNGKTNSIPYGNNNGKTLVLPLNIEPSYQFHYTKLRYYLKQNEEFPESAPNNIL